MTDEQVDPPPAYDPDDDEWAAVHRALGKEWCRPCAEWHNPPECWIDTEGVSRFDQPTT